MKTIIMSILLISITIISNSQQQSLFSQYLFNGFLINPAIAGSDVNTPIQLTAREQWAGIDGAPSTQAISGHTSLGLKESIGVGGYLYNDKFGPVSRIGIHGAFAYHMNVSANTKLAFGLSLSVFQYKISEGGLNIINSNDVAITGKTEAALAPDANFGMYLYHKKFFAGLSSTQILSTKLNINDAYNLSNVTRHYYLLSGYKFEVSKSIDVEPSILVKMTEYNPLQVDINAKIYYLKNYWLGFSYRTDDAIVVMLGLKYDRFKIGYAFDYTASNLSTYTYGSHEVMLGMELSKPKNSRKVLD